MFGPVKRMTKERWTEKVYESEGKWLVGVKKTFTASSLELRESEVTCTDNKQRRDFENVATSGMSV